MAEQTLLTGYKVLDFTHAFAGPTTTRLMAEMGAEVIKVEQAPNGDPARLVPGHSTQAQCLFCAA